MRKHLFGFERMPGQSWAGGRARRGFGVYFWFVGWCDLQLGFHVCLEAPNIELHVPFGFIRIGWILPW